MDPAAARSPLATATPSRRWPRLMIGGQWAVLLIYLICGSLWILGSDSLIAAVAGDRGRRAGLQNLDGLLYVLVTAALLYLLLRGLTASQQRLQASEQRYRSLFLCNPVPMWIYAPESLEILAVNDAALALHGSRREEFLALRMPALWPEQDGARLAAHLAAARAAPGPLAESMHRLRTRSGSCREVVLFDCPVDTPEQPARLVAIHDRTAELQDGSGRPLPRGILQDIARTAPTGVPNLPFRKLVEVMPDGMLVLESKRAIFANPAFRLEFALGEEPLAGLTLPTLVVDDDRERFGHWLRQAPAEGEALLLTPAPLMRRCDGSKFRAGIVQQVTRHDGRIYQLLFVRDLSDAERMRDALAAGNAELQALARRLFSLQEDERRAISRDLHDDIGQAITAMKLSAHAAMEEADPGARREELEEIVALADATVVKLRDLSTLLRPPQLDALGLEASIRWQAGRLLRASDITLDLQLTPLPIRPAREVEQACFRIAQECLTNIVRHAHAGQVTVGLRDIDGQWLQLRVQDDGDGFEPAEATGLGLVVMRERAQGVGGLLKMHTAPGAGTTVELRLPYLPSTASPD